ncbi:putative ATP-grasp-modified RiPP [Streptomyces sp. 4R-3d]|nr:putative ATP-grasp-modified RiPP [Streptomyces sp. 4R-3d]
MGPYAGTTAVPRCRAVIDPESQIALIVDECGRLVELGGHGTSTSGLTPTSTPPGGRGVAASRRAPCFCGPSRPRGQPARGFLADRLVLCGRAAGHPAHGEPGTRHHPGSVGLGAQALAPRRATWAVRPGPSVCRGAVAVGRWGNPRVVARSALSQPSVGQPGRRVQAVAAPTCSKPRWTRLSTFG